MREQGGNFAAEATVVAAGLAQEGIAFGGFALQRLVEDFLNLLLSIHRWVPLRRSIRGAATPGQNFNP
jgi:hypothetical protein